MMVLPFAVAFQSAPPSLLIALASALAIVCGVLLLPQVAEAFNPPMVTWTIPRSYVVLVVASLPPVNVTPDDKRSKLASPVERRVTFPALPGTTLVRVTAGPRTFPVAGAPLSVNAATISFATSSVVAPAV